jgi:catechol 2,3-dioxygenase-like lactoylglutathione lyase family enzyme
MVATRCLRLTAALLVVGACTGTTPTPTQTPSPNELIGEMRSLGIDGTRTSLTTFDLASGATRIVRSSIPAEVANLGAVAATPDAGWLVGAEKHEAHLYRVVGDGSPKVIGPGLPLHGSTEPTVAIASGAAAVATCQGVFGLAFASPTRWLRLGSGCWVALSDDGRSLAYSPDGHHLVIRPFAGHRASSSLDLNEELAPQLGLRDPKLELVGRPAWGPAGLAFALQAKGQIAVFVRDPSGHMIRVLQEDLANRFGEPLLAWQPHGTILAIGDDVGRAGPILRIVDIADGSHRAIGSDVIGFAGLAWSPKGDALSILTAGSALIVMTPDGTWLLRRETDWRRLLSWSGEG